MGLFLYSHLYNNLLHYHYLCHHSQEISKARAHSSIARSKLSHSITAIHTIQTHRINDISSTAFAMEAPLSKQEAQHYSNKHNNPPNVGRATTTARSTNAERMLHSQFLCHLDIPHHFEDTRAHGRYCLLSLRHAFRHVRSQPRTLQCTCLFTTTVYPTTPKATTRKRTRATIIGTSYPAK